MAKKWSQADIATTTTDMQVMGLAPDVSTTSGLKQVRIAIVDFFATLTAAILDNETDIIDHEDRIDDLENGLTKNYDDYANTSFQIPINANSRTINFGFKVLSGNPIVAVGTGTGLDDVVSSRAIEGQNSERSVDISYYTEDTSVLYVSVNSGTIAMVRYSRENVYS